MFIVFIMLVNVSFYLPALYIISECNDKAWPTQRCDLPVFFCNFDPVQLIFSKNTVEKVSKSVKSVETFKKYCHCYIPTDKCNL